MKYTNGAEGAEEMKGAEGAIRREIGFWVRDPCAGFLIRA